MDRNRVAYALLLIACVIAALLLTGTPRLIAALAALLAGCAGVIRELRTRGR